MPQSTGLLDRRLRDLRTTVATDGLERRHDGHRTRARRRLVPAVPEPLARQPRIRTGRGAVRLGRRGRELLQCRLRPVRWHVVRHADAGQSVWRSSRRGRHRAVGTDRRGRLAAQPGPAHDRRPAGARRLGHQDRSGHRGRLANKPAPRFGGSQRASHGGVRVAEPVPLDCPARDEGDLDRRRRQHQLGRGGSTTRPIDGLDSGQLRLAVLGGARDAAGVHGDRPEPVRLAAGQRGHARRITRTSTTSR